MAGPRARWTERGSPTCARDRALDAVRGGARSGLAQPERGRPRDRVARSRPQPRVGHDDARSSIGPHRRCGAGRFPAPTAATAIGRAAARPCSADRAPTPFRRRTRPNRVSAEPVSNPSAGGRRGQAAGAARRPRTVRSPPLTAAWRRASGGRRRPSCSVSAIGPRRRSSSRSAISSPARAEQRHPAGRARSRRRGAASSPKPPAAAGRRADEQERQLAVTLVPGGNGGIGDQRARCRRRPPSRAGRRRRPAARPPRGARARADRWPRWPAVQRRVGRQDPRADAHRRGRLEHAQHVHESRRAAEVLDQRGERER